MQRIMIIPACVSLALCSMLLAADRADLSPQAAAAVTQQFGDAKVDVLGSKTINGVKTYDVQVQGREVQTLALVTESGDFLLSGIPQRRREVPAAVRQTIEGLFKNPDRTPTLYTITVYQADIEMRGGQVSRVDMDAAGRLRDINDAREDAEATYFAKVEKDRMRNVDKIVADRFAGAKFTDLLQGKQDKEAFIAHFEKDGQRGRLMLDKEGNILGTSIRIDPKDMPQSVRETIDRTMGADRVKAVRRIQKEFYQFEVPALGGEMIRVKVLANGDVWQIVNPAAAEEEKTVSAGHKGRGDRKP